MSEAANQADLGVLKYDDTVRLLTRDLKPGYADRIRQAFADALGVHCAKPIWIAVKERMKAVKTRRTIRGVLKMVVGLTQEQAGDSLGVTQSTVSKWLSGGEGSGEWSNMALAMTRFEVDLEGLHLPDLDSRLRKAFIGCLTHTRRVEFGERNFPLPDEEAVECLAVQYRENSLWFRAKKGVVDPQEREELLERAAADMAAIADEQCNRKVRIRTGPAFTGLECEWGASWLLDTYVIKIPWEGRHERYS